MKTRLLAVILSIYSIPAFAQDQNRIQVINHAVASFEKRFQMIERAEKSIDVEYFIYNTDEAGRLFTQALIKKKIQNPKIMIRVLLDASATVLALKPAYVAKIQRYGIQVRYYNPVSPITHFAEAQYRDHRKIIVIDSKEAITGSRNIGDEYFDMSPEFNFTDRDVWVEGPIVKEMKDSFNEYWKNEQTFTVSAPARAYTYSQALEEVESSKFLMETDYDRFMRSEIKRVGEPILADPESTGSCESLEYVSDMPGFPASYKRKVLPKIFERTNKMKKGEKLYIESPYFIVRDQASFKEMALLKAKNISTILLTNSLFSTDAFYVSAHFYPKASLYQRVADSQMYIYEGQVPKNQSMILEENGKVLVRDAVFGIHSKTFVFGDSSFTIGTFNVDPRSAHLNSEMMLFCEGNSKLTDFVTQDIQSRIAQSDLLDKNGRLKNGKSLFDGVGVLKRIKFGLAIKPAEWFSFLL